MTFKATFLAAATAALLASSAATIAPATAQTDRDGQQRWINVVNRTNLTIREFYMTDVDTRGWGDDRLGDSTIDSGESMRVVPTRRQRDRGYCQFDMKVVFENDRSVERRGVNLCSTTNLVCVSTSSCRAQ
ncbi:hypothetical protein E8L99_15800 [Phreatobacter aquaticus]|uniref:Uncharacterized protein n=1 Tax=Phreatobacter aquaticus TaxID=2570229 RepID=A0A4D7QNK2_9HYPH|nr:hypothetical protein [Phreatobacter aquaticus]QCK87116.1 hypothetical protein E8L99_15800 [Phreatobacter aquaticus]